MMRYGKMQKCNTKWVINVYYATIVSTLVYGLECLQMTEKQMGNVDTFFTEGSEKIKVRSTFIDRRYTNQWLIGKANEECKLRDGKRIVPNSIMI